MLEESTERAVERVLDRLLDPDPSMTTCAGGKHAVETAEESLR